MFYNFSSQTVYFTEQNVLLKQPITIDYLNKQKPRGALAGKQEREKGGGEEGAGKIENYSEWRVTVYDVIFGKLKFLDSHTT